MSNDDKNTRRAPNGMEPIRVQEIRFCVKDGRDIPLPGVGINGGKDILRAGDNVNGGELTIEYKPWLRHHHVRWFTGTGDKRAVKSECLIHESWVTWVPFPGEAP